MSDMKIPKGKIGIAKSVVEMAKEMMQKKASVLPKEEAEANLKKFLEPSKVQQRLFHSTFSDFSVPKTKHGSDEYFKFGIHVGPLEAAESRIPIKAKEDLIDKRKSGNAGANIMPVHIQLRNPLRLNENRMGRWGVDDIMHEVMQKADRGELPNVDQKLLDDYFDDQLEIRGKKWSYADEPGEKSELLSNFLNDIGFDGIVYKNEIEGGGDSYLLLNPNQVKSAIGNRGTYDIGEKDITKAKGGAVKMRDGGDPVRAAIEQAVSSGKPRRPIALTAPTQQDIDRMRAEIADNARRVAALKEGMERQRIEEMPPAEMKAYEPTTRQRLGEMAERALRKVSPAPRARALADVMTGGREGAMLSAADFVPFLGTGMAVEEIAPHVKEALSQGNYGEAALYGGLGIAAAVPGIPSTVKGAKAIGKALAPKAGELAEQYAIRTGMVLPMDVWHGSPYRFQPTAKNPLGEFNPTKIGTGEGAQAYGHGFYLAEAPDVAKSYVPRDMKYEEKLLKMYQQAERSRNYDAMEVLESAMMHKTPKELMEQYPNQAGLVGKIKNIPYNAGALYKVDLPDEQIAKMLDWDKPLTKDAPQEVKDAFNRIIQKYPELKDKFFQAFKEGRPGYHYYSLLNDYAKTGDLLKNQAFASDALREAGIPGIRYLDQGSRGAGQGTSNFVVFPGMEDILTIKERMKKGGPVEKAGGGIARRLAKYAKSFEPSKKTEIFIGEKSEIWDAPAAAKAVKLEKAGVDPVEIWKQTGTFRSPDGKLRQEISDVGSKFRGEKEMKELVATMKQQEADIKQKIKESKEHPDLFPKQLKAAQGALRQAAKEIKQIRTMEGGPEYRVGLGNKAGFAFEHPELYEAYPKLLDMDVQQGGRSGSARGSYIAGINENDPGLMNIYDQGLQNDPRSTALHEMQHAVQGLEGFGAGGNPAMAYMHPEAHEILNLMRKQAREPMSYEEYAKKAGLDSMPLGDAMKEYEKYKKAVPDVAQKMDREFQNEAAMLFYQRLAGEAESRAVQERMLMTPSQRKETFPLSSYDVLPEDVITKFEKKKGGPVSLDSMRLAVGGMAGGGIRRIITEGIEGLSKVAKSASKAKKEVKEYRTPAKFERVPAKTKEEIEELARRMAPQYLGEFVRKPESTFSVAGKSMKQYKREKDLPIIYSGDRPTPDVFDISKHEGSVMVGVPGDPTIAHRTLEQIGDIRPETPVKLHGGPLYGLEGEFWASGKGPATGLQATAQRGSEAYGGVPVLGKYIRMPEGTPYALHTTDALLQFQRPDMLGNKKLKQLNAEIRRGNLKNKFPEFVGFEDPDLVLLQAQDNPNLRKHINNVLLKPTTTEKYGLRMSGPDIDAAITEAELRNLETGSTGFSVGRLYPKSNLTESAHPTYEFDIPGRLIGQTRYPQPYELSFPDTLKFARENLKPGVGEFGMFKMIGPRQIIDSQLVDEIKMYEEAMKILTGKKQGGPVYKSSGGILKSLNAMRAFIKASKEADIAKKSKEAAAKGEVYIPDEETKRIMQEALKPGMPEKPEGFADGGQITSDDLIIEERAL